MNIIIKKLIENPLYPIIFFLNRAELTKKMSDVSYLKIYHFCYYHKKLNLKNPVTFNEKLQWLKIYDREDRYSIMADKAEAKKYVSNLLGGGNHIIPTIGVFESFDDININNLPNKFVIKCTHDSGSVIICKDKKTFDWGMCRKTINKALECDYYRLSREWPYKNIKHRIIIEEYMEPQNGEQLKDYKFYCFNGEPKFLYVSQDLTNHANARISFLNLDWTFAEFRRTDYKPLTTLPEKPECYDEMLLLCKRLCENTKFVRIDFYSFDNKIYFSEFTFYPQGAFCKFSPPYTDRMLGDLLHI